MFTFFKKTAQETEEDRVNQLAKLESEAKRLNYVHAKHLSKLLYIPGGRNDDDYLAWFLGFYVSNNKIVASFKDAETLPGNHRVWVWDRLLFMYGEDVIERFYTRYLKLKNQFSLLGVELVLKEK